MYRLFAKSNIIYMYIFIHFAFKRSFNIPTGTATSIYLMNFIICDKQILKTQWWLNKFTFNKLPSNLILVLQSHRKSIYNCNVNNLRLCVVQLPILIRYHLFSRLINYLTWRSISVNSAKWQISEMNLRSTVFLQKFSARKRSEIPSSLKACN